MAITLEDLEPTPEQRALYEGYGYLGDAGLAMMGEDERVEYLEAYGMVTRYDRLVAMPEPERAAYLAYLQELADRMSSEAG